MTLRAEPMHKQQSRLQTIKEVMERDALRAEQAHIYFDWCVSKGLFQQKQQGFVKTC
jgi:hypothetical protein